MGRTIATGGVGPSKSASGMAVIVGIGMLITVAMFFVQPVFGIASFVALWVLTLVSIGGFHLVNALSRRGVHHTQFSIESEHKNAAPDSDFADRVRDLEQLRSDGLITEDEFQHKRREVVRSEW